MMGRFESLEKKIIRNSSGSSTAEAQNEDHRTDTIVGESHGNSQPQISEGRFKTFVAACLLYEFLVSELRI